MAKFIFFFFFFAVFSICCTVISCVDLSQLDFDKTFNIQNSGNAASAGKAMWLPLHLSPPRLINNSSSFNGFKLSRRHLYERRPNARMYLHDDLLNFGYYTTRMWIGTPPQMFALITDSGSTVTYVDCAPCTKCGDHQDPKFQSNLSTTYQAQKCSAECRCDKEKEHCIYDRHYAEMSSNSGILGEDLVSFGNLSDIEPHRVVFGCANAETGELFSQSADGIIGLGRGDLSIVDQLVGKGFISNSFSLCYGGMDVGGGAMVLGGISTPPEMVYTSSKSGKSPYYSVDIKEIHVAGKTVNIDPQALNHRRGAVLDSGTTYAYFPKEVFVPIKDAILKELESLPQVESPDPDLVDWCFSGAENDVTKLSKYFPDLEMVFGDGQSLTLSPENYMFRNTKFNGSYCLGIFENGRDPTTLLGGIIVRNTLVTYDREKERIGFWKTNCSELWERLQEFNPPPPMPSKPDIKNSSDDVTQSYSPSESPEYNTPGEIEFEVGQITFYMSLNIDFSQLKPHIDELTESISKELHVNASQIHLVNITSNGSESLIRWAVSPAGSSDFIPNVTAMEMISLLSENSLHLPDTFGSFKVYDWNIEPSPRHSWWVQHYMVVLVTFVVITLIIGVSVSVRWFMRRKQESDGSYKPVSSAVPEQELEPLQS